jgi:hypothetical protein
MFAQIAYHPFFGLPVVAYLGMLTLLLFIFTASVGYSNFKGKSILPFKWHPRLAVTALIFALIHAIFALSIHIGF